MFNVFTTNADGSDLRPLTQGPEGTTNLLAGISSDGQHVLYYATTVEPGELYTDNKNVELWVTDIQDGQPLRLTQPNMGSYLGAAVWETADSVVFVGWNADGMGIFRSALDGTAPQRIGKTIGGATGQARILSFDAAREGIYWASGGYCGRDELCSARYFYSRLDGSQDKQVWVWVQAGPRVSLSPDGKWLAYELRSSDPSEDGCYVSAVDGSSIQKLGGDYSSCLSNTAQGSPWSPDSRYLLYVSRDRENMKWPMHLFSPGDSSMIDLPDLQTAACGDPFWLDEQQIFLAQCRSNFTGFDVPAAMRVIDLNSSQVRVLNTQGMCQVTRSPDAKHWFLYNCYSDYSEGIRLHFYQLELSSGETLPIFQEALSPTAAELWYMTSPMRAAWTR